MARAYAETIWKAEQENQEAAQECIRAVFGWAERRDSQSGAVVFHDAWPTTWPPLQPDIANNHHPGYYGGTDDTGDWENPVPVYFLSIASGVTFYFAISPRRAKNRGDGELVTLARDWLQAALVHEGAGAKTHAGYGRFRLDAIEPARPERARHLVSHTLTLATPAFLAGAQQNRRDCNLRSATLRGLLRWWWRTMHAAHLGRDDLRRLETALWGDAQQGASLSLSVRDSGQVIPTLFNYKGTGKDRFGPKPEFFQAHDLQRRPPNTTQGLFYASYGMDEKARQRHYVEPGARWTITFNARRAVLADGPSIEAADVLRQGEAALWLLCRYGGVGSKSRKGFGSFADIEVDGIATIDECKAHAATVRRVAGLAAVGPRRSLRSLSIDNMLEPVEVETPWHDPWQVLDQIGFSMQAFAQKNKHEKRKAALGLPRQIHGPRREPMRHQSRDSHRSPQQLRAGSRRRHAAPIHYHLGLSPK